MVHPLHPFPLSRHTPARENFASEIRRCSSLGGQALGEGEGDGGWGEGKDFRATIVRGYNYFPISPIIRTRTTPRGRLPESDA